MLISLKGTESARKVINVGLIYSHFDWKVLKLKTCLRVIEVPKLVLRWSKSMTRYEYKAIWLWSVLCTYSVFKLEDQDQTQDEVEV